MSIELTKKYAPYTDELFKAESKKELLTNTDFDWSGAHTVAVWKVSTVGLNNYARNRYKDDYENDYLLNLSAVKWEDYDFEKDSKIYQYLIRSYFNILSF